MFHAQDPQNYYGMYCQILLEIFQCQKLNVNEGRRHFAQIGRHFWAPFVNGVPR